MTEITSLGPVHSGLGTIRNLDYVILLCDDIASMRRFYTESIGLELHEEIPERWVAFRIGSSLLALRRRGRPYDGPNPADSAGVQLAFRVPPAELEAVAAQLDARGIELLEAMAEQTFGHCALFRRS